MSVSITGLFLGINLVLASVFIGLTLSIIHDLLGTSMNISISKLFLGLNLILTGVYIGFALCLIAY